MDEEYNIAEYLHALRENILRSAELEAQRMKDPDWEYVQVWIIPSGCVDKLPENPGFLDYVDAGAMFQGYQWVHKGD